jgi:hypothetical protein
VATGESVIYIRLPRGKAKVRRELKGVAASHDLTVSDVAMVALEYFLGLSKSQQKKLLALGE